MVTRRDFLQTAAALGTSQLVWGLIPDVIARAASIDPDPGTTFHDAEHVVVLMQENRSFDHAFGSLAGVRGFRDPRPHVQPSGHAVWFQPQTDGQSIPPFRLDIEGTNATWIGGTSHSWGDQIEARNGGRYNRWLQAKERDDGFPMTMGFFTREDIPFYYALADAFTICDQSFCSSLTGTTPNRLFLWSGTIREDADHNARTENGDTDYGVEASWVTFPERLEDAGIPWRIYQNEISIDSGLAGEYDAWLTNFTDNPIEWFSQYRVRFSKTRRDFVPRQIASLESAIAKLNENLSASGFSDEDKAKASKELAGLRAQRDELTKEATDYNDATWRALSDRDRALHEKAFSSNVGDPDYRNLSEHSYQDGDETRKIFVPKGDVLHQFRADVAAGHLPSVSWIIAPEHFSDHPGSAWFGAWYLSEVLHILTENPDVWKKTVLILCYDENDGYFDHVPPFIAPHPGRPETGLTSGGLDTALDVANVHGNDHAIGLGYRVPLVMVSPWSRGGCVNSQVSDHTSIIMFLETWLAGKGKSVHEANISPWRRTICGDLTSCFQRYDGDTIPVPTFLNRDSYIERIHKASFKHRPKPGAVVADAEIATHDIGAFQERGSRRACPLPYRIEASLRPTLDGITMHMAAGKGAGCAFNAYAYGPDLTARAYAVKSGDTLSDRFATELGRHVRLDGPNGFLREIRLGDGQLFFAEARAHGKALDLTLAAHDKPVTVHLRDVSYGAPEQSITLAAGESKTVRLNTDKASRWYDWEALADGIAYRFAGKIETGDWGVTDPAFA